MGELYAYVPQNDANALALKSVPHSHQNPDYGFSVGRGLWTFEAGKWTAIAERVKMNTVGHADGAYRFVREVMSLTRRCRRDRGVHRRTVRHSREGFGAARYGGT